MNATDLTQLIAAIGTLIGVLVTAILTLRNGWKTDVVAAHVNSSATAAQAEIKSLQQQIQALKADMADKKQIAALLADKVPSQNLPQQVEVVNKPEDPVPTETIKKK